MTNSRRQFLVHAARIVAATVLPGCVTFTKSRTLSRVPDPATFEAGDFVWPKPPGLNIPYESRYTADERAVWETERRQFLESVRTNPTASLADLQAAAEIEALTFATFKRRYLQDAATDTVDPFGGVYAAILPVGHVGIVFFSGSDKPSVADAMPMPFNVVRIRSYQEWLAERPDQAVWHGRLNEVPRDKRALIAYEAIKYSGRPYRFFNLDLSDDSAFYCSKLVWLSTYRALGLVLDGNPNPRRRFWFSPKQLMKSPHVCLLHNPEPYASEAGESLMCKPQPDH